MTSSTSQDFLCGVIEGFYGDPWAFSQKHDLYEKLRCYGLNTYVYAPKDDLKHREIWRTMYTDQELAELSDLIKGANDNKISFVYALSPGKDLDWGNPKDVDLIIEKLNQVKFLGCSGFAILFDDIDKDDADRERISKQVMDQVKVANEVYERLGKPLFMFCPTEYSLNKAIPNLEESTYLNGIGEHLHPDIYILWTGSNVVPQYITIEHARQVSQVLRRKPLIWENYFANDYDYGFNRILYLGPFSDRSTDLKNELSGILLNPNCQYECNFVPIFTIGEWNRCGPNDHYDPRQSFERGLALWLEEFTKEIELNDLRLMADLFYLPFLYGNTGKEMVKDVFWLIEHSRDVYNEWNMKYFNVQTWFDQMSKVYRFLYKAKNKQLAKELYPFVQEAQGILSIVVAVLDALKQEKSIYRPEDMQCDDIEILKERGWLRSSSFKDIIPDLLYVLQKQILTSDNVAKLFPLNLIQKSQDTLINYEPSCYAYRVWTKFSSNYSTILYKKFASKQEQEICSKIYPKNPEQYYFDKHFAQFMHFNRPNNIFICEKFITYEDKELKQMFSIAYFIEDIRSLRGRSDVNKYAEILNAQYDGDDKEQKINLLKEDTKNWPIDLLPIDLFDLFPSMICLFGPLIQEHLGAFRRLLQCCAATLGFRGSLGFFLVTSEDNVDALKLLWDLNLTRLDEYKIPNYVIFAHRL